MDALGVTISAVGAALFLAVVIERVTEAFVAPFVPERFSAYIPFGTLGLGLLGAFAFGVDVVTPTFEALGASTPYPAGIRCPGRPGAVYQGQPRGRGHA